MLATALVVEGALQIPQICCIWTAVHLLQGAYSVVGNWESMQSSLIHVASSNTRTCQVLSVFLL